MPTSAVRAISARGSVASCDCDLPSDTRSSSRRIVGQQQHLRIRPVLGLRQQVGGDECGIGAGIGDHQHFRRAGRHVDGDRAAVRDLLLGFGDVAVAGPEQLVAARTDAGAEGHRRDRLGAAELEHARRCRSACAATSTAGSALPSLRGGVHSTTSAQPASRAGYAEHQRGRRQRRGAGRHVQADPADRTQDAFADARPARFRPHRAGPCRRGGRLRCAARLRASPRAAHRAPRLRRQRIPLRRPRNLPAPRSSKRAVNSRKAASPSHAHLAPAPRPPPRVVAADLLRGPLQRRARAAASSRRPVQPVHRAALMPASFPPAAPSGRARRRASRSSSRCQVTAPWHSACSAQRVGAVDLQSPSAAPHRAAGAAAPASRRAGPGTAAACCP